MPAYTVRRFAPNKRGACWSAIGQNESAAAGRGARRAGDVRPDRGRVPVESALERRGASGAPQGRSLHADDGVRPA